MTKKEREIKYKLEPLLFCLIVAFILGCWVMSTPYSIEKKAKESCHNAYAILGNASTDAYDKGYFRGWHESQFMDCTLPEINQTLEVIYYDESVYGTIRKDYITWETACKRLELTKNESDDPFKSSIKQLKGDYSNSSITSTPQSSLSFIELAEIICVEDTSKCTLITEINYEVLLTELEAGIYSCNVTLEENTSSLTDNQSSCIEDVLVKYGYYVP